MLKIDLHTHILPENWPDLQSKYGYGGFIQLNHHAPCKAQMMVGTKFFREIGSNCWDPQKRIEECDHHKVNVQVLSTVPVLFNYWAKPQDTLDFSRYLNDHIAEVVANYPKRFVGLGTVPLQDPSLAIKELERCVKELKLAGVEIGTHINSWNLDAKELFPFFQAAQELNAAIFVHPWDMLGRDRMEKYWLPWLVGMPAETAVAICSLIFGGVLEKLPKLRFAFAHGGGAFPGIIGRVEHGFNVRPDLCAVDNKINPRNYLGKFYLDSLVHDQKALQYLVDLVGENNVILGTDYPFPLGELEPGKLIESMPFDTTIKEKLLAKNALEFLNLNEKVFTQ